jgi:hypothetical protein
MPAPLDLPSLLPPDTPMLAAKPELVLLLVLLASLKSTPPAATVAAPSAFSCVPSKLAWPPALSVRLPPDLTPPVTAWLDWLVSFWNPPPAVRPAPDSPPLPPPPPPDIWMPAWNELELPVELPWLTPDVRRIWQVGVIGAGRWTYRRPAAAPAGEQIRGT